VRLFNFSILTGPEVNNDAAYNLQFDAISSGSSGEEVLNLDRKKPGIFVAAATQIGNDTTEDPYGNVNLYGPVNGGIDGVVVMSGSDTRLVISQSFGYDQQPVSGSRRANFLFIVEKNFRG